MRKAIYLILLLLLSVNLLAQKQGEKWTYYNNSHGGAIIF